MHVLEFSFQPEPRWRRRQKLAKLEAQRQAAATRRFASERPRLDRIKSASQGGEGPPRIPVGTRGVGLFAKRACAVVVMRVGGTRGPLRERGDAERGTG